MPTDHLVARMKTLQSRNQNTHNAHTVNKYQHRKLTLYKHSSNHDWDEFTALEDDLCRVVQVAQRGI